MRARLTAALLVLALACAAAACGNASHGAAHEPVVDGRHVLSRVRYTLAVPADQTEFVTGRGYRIELERAFVSYANIGLTRCAPVPPTGRRADLHWLRTLLTLPVAHAGHDVVLDHSFSDEGIIVDLLSPARRLFAERYFPATSYCRFQFTIGRAEPSFRELPRGVPLEGFTFHAKGRATRDGKTEPFVLETDLPYGSLLELGELERRTKSSGTVAHITLAHDLPQAFEGVDFAQDDLEMASKRVLQRLVDGTRITLELH